MFDAPRPAQPETGFLPSTNPYVDEALHQRLCREDPRYGAEYRRPTAHERRAAAERLAAIAEQRAAGAWRSRAVRALDEEDREAEEARRTGYDRWRGGY